MGQGWHLRKRTVILLHIAAWVLFFSIPLLINAPVAFTHKDFPGGQEQGEVISITGPPRFEWFQIITDLLLVGIFYLNAYVLLSGFIIKRKIWRSLGIQILMFIGFCLVNALVMKWTAKNDAFFYGVTTITKNHFPLDDTHLQPPPPILFESNMIHTPMIPFLLRNSLPYFLIITSSIAYRMIIDRVRANRLVKEKENENLRTELQLLRSQISPHFMFNVLNNMVSLARKGSHQLEPSLIRLSGLMRYMYYDTRQDKIPLTKEIEYIKSYIDLQEQRFQDAIKVRSDIQVAHSEDVIEPMLLIPFVENAFKHGIVLIIDPEINISLSVKNQILHFKVKNKFNPDTTEIKDRTSGIGLTNVKRRLDLSYGDDYILEIKKSEHWHIVLLQLNLT